ncbi:MAG: hypothetical protein DDT23_00004 [candidate division WS2 bacterium]|nr:hypothetical protein [Candidatus Lithacetigena glycinireducens]
MKEDIDDILDPILTTFRGTLQSTLQGHAVNAYLRGSAQLIQWGRTKLTDRPAFYEGPPLESAIRYANRHCAKLVTKIDLETKERLRIIISNAIKEKRGIPGLARDIRREIENMKKYRSELIAKTETRRALFHAFQDRSKAMGVTGKRWILGSGGKEGNCEDCKANAAVGVIPIDDEFPTPQDEVHPGCLCSLAPVMLER